MSGTFLIFAGQFDPALVGQFDMRIEHRRMRFDARPRSECGACNQANCDSAVFQPRQVRTCVVRESRFRLLALNRQSDPGLNPVHPVPLRARLFKTFGMGDSASGNHPVHFSRPNRLFRIQTVAVHDLAREQIGNRRETDMGVRPHIDGARNARRKIHRSHMIEKCEWTNHPLPAIRQHAAHRKTSKTSHSLFDHMFQH